MQEVICVDGCPHQLRQGFLQRLHDGVPGIQGSLFFLTLSLSIIQLLDINAQSAGTYDPLQTEVQCCTVRCKIAVMGYCRLHHVDLVIRTF